MVRTQILALASLVFAASVGLAQDHGGMPTPKAAAKPSTSLTVTELHGKSTSYSPDQFKAMPHITVHVHNAHNNQDESYSGVPVEKLVHTEATSGPQISSNVQVIVAEATDNFRVVITMCDTNPECRSGQSIVADTLDGKPLTADGAFKLVLSEDKKPARWARNLSSLTVKQVN